MILLRRSTHMSRSLTINYIIIVVLGVVAIIAGTFVLRDVLNYREGAQSYDALDTLVEAIPVEQPTPEEVAAQTPDSFWYPILGVDFEALAAINPDFVGWIYVPALSEYKLGNLGYPIAHSKDNEEYLNRTFDGTVNSAGAIFLDKVASPDFTDKNTFIFGHNMRNFSMFGSLKVFGREEGLCASNPYVYIYTTDEVLKYEIFSYYVVNRSDEIAYSDVGDPSLYTEDSAIVDYTTYIEHAKAGTTYDSSHMDFTEEPNILTLSTCYGTGHVQNFIVHAILLGRTSNTYERTGNTGESQ